MARLNTENYQLTEGELEVACDNCGQAGHPTVHILLGEDTEPTSLCYWCVRAMQVLLESLMGVGHACD
jgi:hypothetical protein